MRPSCTPSIMFWLPTVLSACVADDGPSPARSYPSFSWKTLPLYMHVRKATAFTDEEIAYLARFPLITFEKATGHETYGHVEEGVLQAARAVKRVNPRATILYYRNVLVHYGSYAANDELKRLSHPFLVGPGGKTGLVRGRLPAYDLTNPAVRDWWVQACRRVTADPAVDGVFFDGNIKVLDPGYLRRTIGEEKKRALIAGYWNLVRQARQRLGADKLMVANLLRARFPDAGLQYLEPFDGSYLEAFEHPVGGRSRADYVAQGIEAAQTAARRGKIIAFSLGLGAPAAREQDIDALRQRLAEDDDIRRRWQYCLALFLICAERYSYLYAHDGYDANRSRVWLTRLPECDRPLGPPMAPAHREGYIYTRRFQHVDVWMDIEHEQARLSWRQ